MNRYNAGYQVKAVTYQSNLTLLLGLWYFVYMIIGRVHMLQLALSLVLLLTVGTTFAIGGEGEDPGIKTGLLISVSDSASDGNEDGDGAVAPPRKKKKKGNGCSMIIYPNPSKGAANINVTGATISLVEVYDLMGKRLYFASGNDGVKHSLDLSSFDPAVYLLRIHTEEQILTSKLIISN